MKKSLLIAAAAVIGCGAFVTPGAQAWDHHDHWGRPMYVQPNPYAYGAGYVNPYYNNAYGNGYGYGFGNGRIRHEIRRDEWRAARRWDRGLGRWF